MMDLRVYHETEEEPEPVRLRLIRCGKDIVLVAVGPGGCDVGSGRLLGLRPDGTMYRCELINEALGFEVDMDGKIIERMP